jgi:hypothetical protein
MRCPKTELLIPSPTLGSSTATLGFSAAEAIGLGRSPGITNSVASNNLEKLITTSIPLLEGIPYWSNSDQLHQEMTLIKDSPISALRLHKKKSVVILTCPPLSDGP